MWEFILGFILGFFLALFFLFVGSLCKISSESDDAMEEYYCDLEKN